MKKLVYLVAMILTIFVLSSCSGEEAVPEEEELKWVDVNVSINPEKPQPNEPVTFKAIVTYGEDVVTDANEVTFEIWRSKDEKHEEIEVKKATDGAYQIEKTFETEGTYYVIAHVTAESMHNMPKKEFVVGTPSEPEEKAKSNMMEDHEGMEEN